MIQLRAASDVDGRAYIRTFNQAYEDYYMPIRLDEDSLDSLTKRDAIDLKMSVAAVDSQRVVGLAMLAYRDFVGWIGGVGVIPSYRRRGIARQMVNYLIDQGKSYGLESLSLEVFTENIGAFKLYQEMGFSIKRRLLMLERPQEPLTPLDDYLVQYCDPRTALNYYHRFHDIPTPWQRSQEALLELSKYLEGWTVATYDQPIKY